MRIQGLHCNQAPNFMYMITDNAMPRFYFHLRCKGGPPIADNSGKELDSLNDAFEYAQELIDKILFHVGHDDAEAWKVVILNDDHDAQMIVPFTVSDQTGVQRRWISR
jgi:hypothetical protein